jgi:hypothetical protein
MPDDPGRLHTLPPARSLVPLPLGHSRSLVSLRQSSLRELSLRNLAAAQPVSAMEAASAYRTAMRANSRARPILGNGIFA